MRPVRGALALTVVAALAGCTSSGSSPAPTPSPTSTTSQVALRSCPHHVPSSVHDARAPADMLVEPDPTEAMLCRYYPLLGLSGHGVPHGTLYGHANLDAATARKLAADLDAIPQPQAGERIACPAAFGTHDLMFFGYADGRTLTVLATPDGCPSFTNGRYHTGDFSPGFAHYLKLVNRLVPVKQQHPTHR